MRQKVFQPLFAFILKPYVPCFSQIPAFLELFTGRHFWNRKCRKKTWWQQEFAVLRCEATANSVTGHICVNSNACL